MVGVCALCRNRNKASKNLDGFADVKLWTIGFRNLVSNTTYLTSNTLHSDETERLLCLLLSFPLIGLRKLELVGELPILVYHSKYLITSIRLRHL